MYENTVCDKDENICVCMSPDGIPLNCEFDEVCLKGRCVRTCDQSQCFSEAGEFCQSNGQSKCTCAFDSGVCKGTELCSRRKCISRTEAKSSCNLRCHCSLPNTTGKRVNTGNL